MLETIDQSITVYYDEPKRWQTLIKQAMTQNNSWEKSTKVYIEQYKSLIK